MARVLVVGAGGYIGIPLCEELARRDHKVQPVDRFFFGKHPSGTMPCLYADIQDYWCSPGMFDAVIDLAGLSNDASSDIDPDLTRSINLDGAKRLATMAKEAGVERYIYSSSCSVYGHGGPDLTEESELKPLTLYAKCKAEVEDHLRSLQDDSFKVTILRNATVFGLAPRMRFDLVVNVMALNAWRDHSIMVRGGDQWRPLVHVRDVVSSFVRCIEPDWATPWTYNIGATNMQISEIARHVAGAAPWARITRVTEAVDHRDYHVSFAKADKAFPTPRLMPMQGAAEIISALRNEKVSGDDPTTVTTAWYKAIMQWDKRLQELRLDGRIL